MTLERFLVTPVRVVTAGTATNRYDDVRPDWDNPTRNRLVYGWLVELGTTEEVGAREAVVTTWRLILPAGDPISSSDRVTRGADTFEVEGEPVRAGTPSGAHHVEVTLRRVA